MGKKGKPQRVHQKMYVCISDMDYNVVYFYVYLCVINISVV